MEIIFELSDDTLVASLYGELDHHVAEKARKNIDSMMKQYGTKNLIFDFGKVTFMDSAGIGLVLGRYKKCKAEGGCTVIVSGTRRVRDILNLAGIFTLMAYADTKEKGLELLNGEEVS